MDNTKETIKPNIEGTDKKDSVVISMGDSELPTNLSTNNISPNI